MQKGNLPVIRLAGMIAGLGLVATAARAQMPADCPPNGLRIERGDQSHTVEIIIGCLSDPEDLGRAMALMTREVAYLHIEQNLRQSYVAVEEVLVESYVSEILEPSVPAPGQ